MTPTRKREYDSHTVKTSSKRSTARGCGDITIACLPEELLPIIFAFAAELGGPHLSLCVSQVCSQWRRIALASPALWRVVAAPETTLPFVFFDECVRRSNRFVTHARFPARCGQYKLGHCWLNLVCRNKERLLDVELDATHLTYGNTLDVMDELVHSEEVELQHSTHELSQAAPSLMKASLMRIFVGSPELQRIALNVGPQAVDKIDPQALSLSKPAKPRTLIVRHKEPWDGNRRAQQPSKDARWLTFLDSFTTALEHFSFLQDLYNLTSSREAWMRWAWETMLRRSRELRSCHIRANGHTLAAASEITLPSLLELRLYDGPYEYPENYRIDCQNILWHYQRCYKEWMGGPSYQWDKALSRSTWFTTPSLRSLGASPTMASKIVASTVECAYLRIWDPKEFALLPKLLASWPNLLNLTLELMPERFRVAGEHPKYVWTPDWTRFAVEDLLSVLTPGVCGAIHAPQLRHLGLIWCDEPSDSRAADLRWAATPWSESDDDAHLACPIEDKRKSRIPFLSKRTLDVVTQRRQLSQGKAVPIFVDDDLAGNFWPECDAAERHYTGEATAVSGACQPLESLKVGGMFIHPDVWKKLKAEKDLQVTCGAEPETKKKRKSRRK